MTQDKRYVVLCRRSANSIFGAATAYLKNELNQIIVFESKADAKAKADKLNTQYTTCNLYYSVTEYNQD